MGRPRLLALVWSALLVLTACGGGGNAAAIEVPACDRAESIMPASEVIAGEGTASGPVEELQVDRSRLSPELFFYNWSDYIDPQILDDFEQEYGVRVVVDPFDSNEDMIAKVRPGNSGYDIVAPSDYAVQIMVAEGLLAPLDKSLLPNLGYIKPQHLDLYFDEGNQYSVPYFYGTTGIAYNRSEFATPPDSWAALFDPERFEPYKTQFSMLDDERETPGAALKYLCQSVNETDPAALEQAQAVLIQQKNNGAPAAYNSSDVNRKLAGGEYVIAHAYSGDALQARLGLEEEYEGNQDVAYLIPKEGGVIWQDNLAILADSPNQYTAHVFLNYLMRPDVAVKNAEYVLYLTPNAEAEQLLSPDLQAIFDEGFAPDADDYERLEWIVRNEDSSAFTDLWTAVKGE